MCMIGSVLSVTKLAIKDTLVITVMIHVMDVCLNYVTVLMEYVILKTYAKPDGSVLSVTKLVVKDTLVTTVMIHVMDVYLNYVTVLMEYVLFKTYAKQGRGHSYYGVRGEILGSP